MHSRFGSSALFFFILASSISNAELVPHLVSQATYSVIDAQTVAVIGGQMTELNVTHTLPHGVTAHEYPANSFVVQDGFGNNFLNIFERNPRAPYNYIVNTTVVSTAAHVSSLPSEYGAADHNDEYLSSDRLVDASSPKIRSLALSIVANSTSQFERVARLAIFVHNNIAYDTSLVGMEVPAEQILSDPRGVCTEYATLFISLSRSIGIPARYVNGYAYSNKFGSWLGHSWTEVYLGQWVGVDPTWLQVGDIDATHLASVRKPSLGFSTSSVTAMVYPPSARLVFDQPTGSGGLRADNIRLLSSDSAAPSLDYSLRVSSAKLPPGGKFIAWVVFQSDEYRVVPMSLLSCKGDYEIAKIASPKQDEITAPATDEIAFWEGEVPDYLPENYRFSCPATFNSPYFEADSITINVTTADPVPWPALSARLEDDRPGAGSLQRVEVPYSKDFAGQKITIVSKDAVLSTQMGASGASFVFPAGSPGIHTLYVFGPFGDPVKLTYDANAGMGVNISLIGFARPAFELEQNRLSFMLFAPPDKVDGIDLAGLQLEVELAGQKSRSKPFNVSLGQTNVSIEFSPQASGENLLVARLFSGDSQIASASSLVAVSQAPSASLYQVSGATTGSNGALKATFQIMQIGTLPSMTLRVGEQEVPVRNGRAIMFLMPGNYNGEITWQMEDGEHSSPFKFSVEEPKIQQVPSIPFPELPEGSMSQSARTPFQLESVANMLPQAMLACPVAIAFLLVPIALSLRKKK